MTDDFRKRLLEKREGAKRKRAQIKTFRVFVSQINQTCVEVQAKSADEAREKGYAKWRREYSHSQVCSVEEVLRGLRSERDTDQLLAATEAP